VPVREYTGPTNTIGRVAFVASEPPRLVGVTYREIFLWDLGRPDPIATYPWDSDADPKADVIGSASGRWLGTVAKERFLLRDLSAAPSGPAIEFDLDGILAARFAGRPERLCVLRCDVGETQNVAPEVQSWRITGRSRSFDATGVRRVALPAVIANSPRHGSGWMCKHLSADGRRVGLSGDDRALHVWDVPKRRFLGTIQLRGFPHEAVFSPDGSKLAIDAGTTLYVHDGEGLELRTKWRVSNCEESALAWSPDSRLLARTDESRTVRVYEATSGRQVMAVRARHGRSVSAAFSPDGLTLATGTSQGPVRVWDVDE
jgi:WD40 repeat protein